MNDPKNLWIRHAQQHDYQAREDLILYYTPLVKGIVGGLTMQLPDSLEQADLISYGIIGLIEAVDRFDLSQQVKFETYATRRIRGQIIDSLRAFDLVPRSVYRRNREIQAAVAELCHRKGRMPAQAEVANYLQISLSEYHRWLTDAAWEVISLDQPVMVGDGEAVSLYDTISDEDALTPAEALDHWEMKQLLLAAIMALPEREQLLLSLYYNQALTMKEIGRLLKVSESRVSQIHTTIMLALHSFIQRSIDPDSAVVQ